MMSTTPNEKKEPLLTKEQFKEFVTDKLKLDIPGFPRRKTIEELHAQECELENKLDVIQRELYHTRRELLDVLVAQDMGKTWCACELNKPCICPDFEGWGEAYCQRTGCDHKEDCHKPNMGFIGQ